MAISKKAFIVTAILTLGVSCTYAQMSYNPKDSITWSYIGDGHSERAYYQFFKKRNGRFVPISKRIKWGKDYPPEYNHGEGFEAWSLNNDIDRFYAADRYYMDSIQKLHKLIDSLRKQSPIH